MQCATRLSPNLRPGENQNLVASLAGLGERLAILDRERWPGDPARAARPGRPSGAGASRGAAPPGAPRRGPSQAPREASSPHP